MTLRSTLLLTVVMALVGCGGSRADDANPIGGLTDCGVLAAQGSTLCDDVDAQAAARERQARSISRPR